MGKRSIATHEFKSSLAMSHRAEDLPLWEECYRNAFPSFLAMHSHRQDGPHQRAGIDRSIILENSKQILIDEKIRGTNRITGRVYEDIALEYWSDTERKSPGWVSKPLLADYIAYAIAPLGRCYLLPVMQLQSAWLYNSDKWVKEFGYREAKNTSWVTRFCTVPVDVLFKAIGRELRIDFTPCEWQE